MMGPASTRSDKLFYVACSLEDRVPSDHLLRRIDQIVNFDFVRREVASCYGTNGHVSLDPAMVMRMMLVMYLEGIRSERAFMRQLPMRLDWLWFCRLDLDSVTPDHSVLSKARRRWGKDLFRRVFDRVLDLCCNAGMVDGETVYADSTLLKANADRDGRISRILWEQLENGLRSDDPSVPCPAEDASGPGPAADSGGDDDDESEPGAGSAAEDHEPAGLPFKPFETQSPARSDRAKLNNALVSPVDPDAAVHTRKAVGTILGYRDHRLTDDQCGIILATHVTAADGDDGAQLPLLLAQMEARLGRLPDEVVGDSMYGTRNNYAHCRERGVKAYLKKRRGKDTPKVSWLRLLPSDCTPARAIRLMMRRRTVAEGSFAEAHTLMDHWRCRWRRLHRVQIQAYLAATAQNIKKLLKKRPRRKTGGSVGPREAELRSWLGLEMIGSLAKRFPVSLLGARGDFALRVLCV